MEENKRPKSSRADISREIREWGKLGLKTALAVFALVTLKQAVNECVYEREHPEVNNAQD